MARSSSSSSQKSADWPHERTLAALKKQLSELDNFRGRRYNEVENEEQAWQNLTLNILTHGFGVNSNNVSHFYRAQSAGEYSLMGMSNAVIQRNFEKRVNAMGPVLKSSIAELELMLPGHDVQTTATTKSAQPAQGSRKIFLVHGHDDGLTNSIARLLERLDLDPIILHEQPNLGKTIIEKFEANADVHFAIVLLTADDVGRLATDEQLRPRARQNVILELGYFIGRLGRARVCALHEEGVDIPSDFHGVLYVPLDSNNAWKFNVAQEIRAAGIEVDMNRI